MKFQVPGSGIPGVAQNSAVLGLFAVFRFGPVGVSLPCRYPDLQSEQIYCLRWYGYSVHVVPVALGINTAARKLFKVPVFS